MPLSLQNKKIVISAGASGIGWATTKVCLSKGAIVYICDIDKSNLIKVQEDQFLDEFLPKVVCSNANCEVVDKSGNIKGYLTQKELSKALTKEHMADAAKSN